MRLLFLRELVVFNFRIKDSSWLSSSVRSTVSGARWFVLSPLETVELDGVNCDCNRSSNSAILFFRLATESNSSLA